MPEQWKLVEGLLDAVLALPASERQASLDRLTAGQPELRAEVESLLDAHDRSGGFLATSAESFARPFLIEAAASEPSDQPGVTVGRYRLVRQIGRGGMGTVWLAERSDGQFEHQVALKLIKRGMDSDEVLARFLRERQILARLEHPNIARLLDGGVNDDGRPYFVMEYVPGGPITTVSEQQQLSLDAKLRLFVVACRAVGHAHRNLVVHRDIKPSNVLVDQRGELKLLDFGIARLLGDEDDPMLALTAGTGRLMTPEYASPEQLARGKVTTASDVYQLGILLFELLTGERPREARPPSAVNHDRQLWGDLDTITLRAIREEPELRYPSAEDLAEDVERHLDNRPLRFGGDRAAYRAGKFIRRHRVGVSAGALMVALTAGLLGWDSVRVRQERDRARHEADKAAEVGQLMARFLEGWNPDASDRGEVSAKKLLGEAAVRAERELAGRPEMLAATLSLLGDFHTTLGEWRAADSLLSRVLALQERAGPGTDLAATLVRRGRLYRQSGRYSAAEGSVERALELHRSFLGSRHPETLRVERELALVYRTWNKHRESERVLRSILDAIDRDARQTSPFALEVASDLGYALFQQARFDEAVEILRPTLDRQRALFGEIHLSTLGTTRALGSALRDRGNLDEAEALYRDALRIARALFGEVHSETESVLLVLALVLERKNQLAEAEDLARQALMVGQRVYGPEHPMIWGHLLHVGSIRLDRGDPAEAERLLRQVLEKTRQAAAADETDQGDVLNRLAYILVARNAPDAELVYREAVAYDDARTAGQPDFVSDGIHFLAEAERKRGDLRAAAEDFRRAVRIYQKQLPITHPYRIAALAGLAAVGGAASPL